MVAEPQERKENTNQVEKGEKESGTDLCDNIWAKNQNNQKGEITVEEMVGIGKNKKQ